MMGERQATGPVIQAEGLIVGYGGVGLLPPIDLAIGPGELWLLAGRNGSGKSTLLRTLLGLLPPVGGRLHRLPSAGIAYLAQKQRLDALVPMRVIDLVSEGVESGLSFLRPWLSRVERERVADAMAITGTTALARRAFTTLSEGQKQKVLLARAMAAHPHLLLLDEPTAAMDLAAEEEAIRLIDDLRRQRGTAVLLVSHDLHRAMARADRVIFVDAEHRTVTVGDVPSVAADPVFQRQFAAMGFDGWQATDAMKGEASHG